MNRATDIIAVDGLTMYQTIRRAIDGFYWTGSIFEVFNSSHWTSYSNVLTKVVLAAGISANYYAQFPTIAANTYRIDVYAQDGGSPSVNDGPSRFYGTIVWNGTAESFIPVISSRIRTVAGILVAASTTAPYSRQIDLPRTLLSLISVGSSAIIVEGAISDTATPTTLFNDTITNTAAVKIDITGIAFLTITVSSGHQVLGNLA